MGTQAERQPEGVMAARGRILGRVQENGKLFPPVPLTTQIEQNGAQARRFLEPPRFYVWPNRWRMNLDCNMKHSRFGPKSTCTGHHVLSLLFGRNDIFTTIT